ncbi:TOMM precursor leader peptide-binding protein [Lipingzhangella sp. LS1_29]|uniref:TOMM leader peptide-binding protein n=1 Tax=Lipingzhangella rawalii TaxID=2055835 RepID=A0ABU2H878_9ACTN|nr:TOMM precursor leader peptide-binding protein [Lipingzhangella rawalii]MDS1270799.1 TOMM precursor leader peptide-binding protein [Lipingzhangella rawalii]
MEPTSLRHDSELALGFKPGLRIETVPGEAVYVFSEDGVTALRGSHVEALAPFLNGTRNLDSLQRCAPAGLSPDAVTAVVAGLTEAGLLGPHPAVSVSASVPAAAYWEAAGISPETAISATATAEVQPIAVGQVDATAMGDSLTAAGLNSGRPLQHHPGTHPPLSTSAELSVVLCTDYLAAGLTEIDAAHRDAERPWLLARPTGARLWLGPIFQPEATGTPCWHCLAHRLRIHRRGDLHAQQALGRSEPVERPSVTIPPLTGTAMNMIALEAAKWIAGYRNEQQGAVWTLDSRTRESHHHEFPARPQCPSCGDPAFMRARAHRPVELHSRPKAADGGAGHRSHTPQEMMERYEHLVSPVTGIVKELTEDLRGPTEFQCFRSGPNMAATGTGYSGLRAALRSENSGKGTSPLHARVSALCEAVERHSGTFHGDEERIRGSYTALAEQAVHPDTCLLIDERQYNEREQWNIEHGAFQYLCAPFDPDTELNWSPLWSLTEQRHRLLPTGMLYFGAPGGPGGVDLRADSNGNAAGSSLEDAILQGSLELIERDAVALWWYNRTRQPEVDLAAFADPWVERMRTVYAGIGREFWVLDLTSDLGVPAMAAVTRNTEGNEDVMFGFGCHLDPRVALRRAVAEMNQLMPVIVDGVHGWGDPDAARWWAGPGAVGADYLRPAPEQRPLGPGDYAYTPRTDVTADVLALRDLFARQDLEMLVLDQTRPDIELPVVKVVVPGLRGLWARFAPGRLFDVPVELGRRSAPTPYDELNPFPMFL